MGRGRFHSVGGLFHGVAGCRAARCLPACLHLCRWMLTMMAL